MRRGAPVALLTRTEVQQLTGSGLYCGGLLDRRGGTVQPLAYVRGLAQALIRAGGRIYTNTPARRLGRITGGWSMKRMHRLMLLSNTYRQSTRPSAEALRRDPENELFSRMNRQRLEGEAIRDALRKASDSKPLDIDVSRVRAKLAEGGWPLAAPHDHAEALSADWNAE